MPYVRCKWYDNNGKPLNGGCSRPQCSFVHPSHPNWQNAPLPRNTNLTSNHRGPRDGGEFARNGGRRNNESDAGSAWVTKTNAIPMGPRRRETSQPTSGWGNAPIGGQEWREESAQASTSATVNTQASASGSSNAGPPPTASTGGWGDPNTDWANDSGSRNDTGWDIPTDFSSWTNPAQVDPSPAATWGQPQPVSTAQTTTSSGWELPPELLEPGRTTFSTASKAKERAPIEIAVAVNHQGSYDPPAPTDSATPRTPRSPNPIRSPDDNRLARDPRRRPSLANTTALTTQSFNSLRTEHEPSRTSSFGVPLSIANAGVAGLSSAKLNPFASFPQYTPAESMQVEEPEESLAQEQDQDMIMGEETEVPREQEIPPGLQARWKHFIRTLSTAVSLQLELRTREESREKYRRLDRSRAYNSASMVEVRLKFKKLRDDAEATIVEKRKRFETSLNQLMQYPIEGLPALSPEDSTRESELQKVRSFAKQVEDWLVEVRPTIEHYKVLRQAEEDRQREEAERRRAKEERRKALEEDKAKWAPINSVDALLSELRVLQENADDTVSDLECESESIRSRALEVEAVVLRWLQERGYESSAAAPVQSQSSIEEGELVSQPQRSEEQLREEVTNLTKRFEKAYSEITESQRHLEESQKGGYDSLKDDYASLRETVDRLMEMNKQYIEIHESNNKAIEDLRNLLNSQCPAQLFPPHPTAEEITAQLETPLMDDLLNIVQRALNSLKNGVEESMRANEHLICQQLLVVIKPALAMIGKVKPVIDRHSAPGQTQSVTNH